MYSFVDTAVIKIPATGRLKIQGADTSTTETAKLFSEGMPVTIELGYDNNLVKEFKGFVSRINFTTPCEIECEGYSYILRGKTYLNVFKNTTLKAILQKLIEGTDIALSPGIADMIVQKLNINGKTGTEALQQIKKELLVDIFFTENELYAGLVYTQEKGTTRYQLGRNVIKDGNLKLHQAKNQEVIIKVKGQKTDGERVTASFGEKGEIKQVSTQSVTDAATLKAIAENEHRKISYDGYEGKITAFLHPYCQPGFSAVVIDKRFTERGGVYLADSTEVVYGTRGARRIVGIGFKLRD